MIIHQLIGDIHTLVKKINDLDQRQKDIKVMLTRKRNQKSHVKMKLLNHFSINEKLLESYKEELNYLKKEKAE
jgi:hypothetical protein